MFFPIDSLPSNYDFGAVDQRPTNPSSKAKEIDWDKLQAQIEEEVIHQPSSFIFFRFCVLQIS